MLKKMLKKAQWSGLTLLILTSVAQAQMNEVECENTFGQANEWVRVDIERPFANTPSRFGWLAYSSTTQNFQDRLSLFARRLNGFNELNYWGSGVDLRIDLWPDTAPRFGRVYRGTLRFQVRGVAKEFQRMSCQFPWATFK